MKKCKKCGKTCDDKNMFCIYCGSNFENNTNKKTSKVTKQSVVIIFMGIIIIIAIAFFIIRENNKFDNVRQSIENYKNDKMISEYLSTPDTTDLKIEQGWDWKKDGNYIYITGSVKNISDKTISYYEVTADFYDSGGNIIDSDWTNGGNDLKPNASSEFEIMHKYDSNIKKVNLEVTDVS